jgi:hypothetical protein
LIPLSDLGLKTVAEVARHHAVTGETVLRWIATGLLTAVPVGDPAHTYLVRRVDCKKLRRPKLGRPRGSRTLWETGRRTPHP